MLAGCSFPITYLKHGQDLLLVFLFSYPPPIASYSDSHLLGDPPQTAVLNHRAEIYCSMVMFYCLCAVLGSAPLHLRGAPNTAPATPLSINSL